MSGDGGRLAGSRRCGSGIPRSRGVPPRGWGVRAALIGRSAVPMLAKPASAVLDRRRAVRNVA